MSLVHIPLAKIILGDDVRTFVPEQSRSGLEDSILAVGLLEPILVREDGNGHYFLIAGRRRYEAVKELGLPDIAAIILSAESSVRHVQLVENLQREELNPVDKAHAVKAFMEEEGLSKTAAAAKLGVPRTTLNDWLQLFDVPEKYQAAVLSNFYGGRSALTPSHITLAKRFAQKVNSPQMLEVILDGVLDYSLTRSEAKRVMAMMMAVKDVSLEQAVRSVRRTPRSGDSSQKRGKDWFVKEMSEHLARSGDYLVKCQPDYIEALTEQEKRDFLRQSRALTDLLDETIKKLEHSIENTNSA